MLEKSKFNVGYEIILLSTWKIKMLLCLHNIKLITPEIVCAAGINCACQSDFVPHNHGQLFWVIMRYYYLIKVLYFTEIL